VATGLQKGDGASACGWKRAHSLKPGREEERKHRERRWILRGQ